LKTTRPDHSFSLILNPAVKEFGQRMVADHSEANDELKSVPSKENINLPRSLSKAHEAAHNRLSKLGGKQFDDAHAKMMISDTNTTSRSFGRNPRTVKIRC
jgi:putative membrane protein